MVHSFGHAHAGLGNRRQYRDFFAVLNAVVLKPLPFAAPDRLMAFASIDRRGGGHRTNLSYPNFLDFRARNDVFEHLVSYRDMFLPGPKLVE